MVVVADELEHRKRRRQALAVRPRTCFFSLAPTVTWVRCLMMRSSATSPLTTPMRSTLGPDVGGYRRITAVTDQALDVPAAAGVRVIEIPL